MEYAIRGSVLAGALIIAAFVMPKMIKTARPQQHVSVELALAAGMTINGLAITGTSPSLYGYYRSRVIGGPSAFVISVDGFEDFQTAMQLKLIRELTFSASLDTKAKADALNQPR